MGDTITPEEIKSHLNSSDAAKKSPEELFDAVSLRIEKMYKYQKTREESREAARNFISFCQLIIDHRIKSAKTKISKKTKEEKLNCTNN